MNGVMKKQESRVDPRTQQSKDFAKAMHQYSDAFAQAKIASDVLAAWAREFVGVEPGMILEQRTRLPHPPGVFISDFVMRGAFSGWKGNAPRMRVDQIISCGESGLMSMPQLQVVIKGVPLKDSGEVFKSTTCSVTVDLMHHAELLSANEDGGYDGFGTDAVVRLIDSVHGSSKATKASAIGSAEWLASFTDFDRPYAEKYVSEKRRVRCYYNDENGSWVWAVAFIDTEFWASSFSDEATAQAQALAWNAQCDMEVQRLDC